jgi:phosphoribosylformylglycinamidine cyclo-ligase
MVTYADAGVNIEFGDDVSKILYNAARETWQNRKGSIGEVIVPFDDFSGLRYIDAAKLPTGTVMMIGFDGIGTKVELAQRLRKHNTTAHDLLAMVVDDVPPRGGEPVLVGSILDVNSLGPKDAPYLDEVKQLATGYVSAAKAANVAIVNGEVAELGSLVGGFGSQGFLDQLALSYIATNLNEGSWDSIRHLARYLSEKDKGIQGVLRNYLAPQDTEFVDTLEKMRGLNYNWGAACVWFAKKDRLFTGNEIEVGDYLVALREEGLRSNGLSLARRVLEKTFGERYEEDPNGRYLTELALVPSRIMCAAVCDMYGGYDREPKLVVHGTANISGGGLPGKAGRMLKRKKLGAVINDPFEPPLIMRELQRLGNVTDRDAYTTWNMGQGMVVATPEPDKAIAVALEHGIDAQVIGTVTTGPEIHIRSKGHELGDKGRVLVFEPE